MQETFNLPTDRPRVATTSFRVDVYTFVLTPELTDSLRAIAIAQETALVTLLRAAFQVLLYRWSGQEQIPVIAPPLEQGLDQNRAIVKFLVWEANFSDNPSFVSTLQQQHYSFSPQSENQQHNLALAPVMFIWEPQIALDTLLLERFDLALIITDVTAQLAITVKYNRDLFAEATILRWMGHFQTLLHGIVANPRERVDCVPLLTAAERQQLLVAWNNTQTNYLRDKHIHQLFETCVTQNPDAVAVVCGDQQLTYNELNARANQLAHYLQSLGVAPEVLVGICVERSLEMVVGVLGIIKTGAAYLPLDPAYPQDRLAFMLEDTKAPVLLTQQHLLDKLPQHQAQVICLDRDQESLARHSANNPINSVQSDNLAYAIYTSGSTGKPKGVAMTGRSLANLLCWHLEHAALSKSAKTLQFAPISFDVSFQEMFSTWCTGGTLVLISEAVRRDAVELLQFIAAAEIERLFLPFVALQQLAEVANTQQVIPTSLRDVITAGEQLQITRQIANWFVKLKHCTLHNHYGPSESHVVTAFTLTGSVHHWPMLPPIGRPIANTQIYLLDHQFQPVPIGLAGELYIGGVSVARGYLNRPEITAEKFIPDPFSHAPGMYLYKTGDLARYLDDGNIEYLGRIDNQVKIRGFRIELGEIESLLNSHPSILSVAVITREDTPGDKRLVAYFVPKPESTPSVSELRRFLKQQLPEYMVPAAFVRLEAMSLTPSGKIDRKGLKAPEKGDVESVATFVAPRTENEKRIAAIWQELLHIDSIGIEDNFFELGGHSLLAVQLIVRLKEVFGVEIPLRVIFDAPTITQIDQALGQLPAIGLSIPPLRPAIRDLEFIPLSFQQERLWFLDLLEGSSAAYNVPLAFSFTGNLQLEVLQQAVAAIVHRHEILRTSFHNIDGIAKQVIHPEVTVKIKVTNLQSIAETERQKAVATELQQEIDTPFNLELAPLIRFSLWKLANTEYVFAITIHHIVADGWSLGVFNQELSILYDVFLAHKPSPLKSLPIQYADFAIWENQWLKGEILDQHLQYWRQQLHHAPDLLQLPTDRPRPRIQTHKGKSQRFVLNSELTQKLYDLTGKTDKTLFMILWSAFATLLYRYSGQTDILLGSTIADRTSRELELLIGLFVNTLVLRINFANNPSFLDLLEQVRQTTLESYEHQNVLFEQVLHSKRSLSYSHLFQVMFVLQPPAVELNLSGITCRPFHTENKIAKFDLTVSVTEIDQELEADWEYSTDLWNDVTIEQMALHFENLLSAIVANPQLTINELPLLSDNERHQLLVAWNDTKVEYPQHKCIQQLFEEQAALTPHAIALILIEQQLTYAQLNAKANQLAHYLHRLGVKPDALVGICVQRSLEMIIGVWGTLKAGGAYVPLDPAYPIARLDYMLTDSGVKVLLTQESLLTSLPATSASVICLDRDWGLIERYSSENLPINVNSQNLAYVIYTSGSTGKPKGVLIEHQSLVNFNYAIRQNFGINTHDRVLQFFSISFDSAAEDIYPSLTSGATLVLRTEEMIQSSAAFLQNCDAWQITVLNLPTAYWSQLIINMEAEHLRLPASVRLVNAGGEEVKLNQVDLWLKQGHDAVLINSYGPTEATVDATLYSIPIDISNLNSIPIGRPIPNTQTYILDPYLQPVPIGVAGELCIGGAGLARGYLNRPELSAEKFIPNPFIASARIYKTGDIARYLPDGNIEYVGRIDNQVKIRGFRIELGEIESALNTHPQVQQTVVLAREDSPGDKRLVAYVVTEDELLQANQLREFLRHKLADYMLPAAFVFLKTLPLTTNGKVERKALPLPDFNLNHEGKLILPRDAIELKLAQIWSHALNVNPIGITDNFFELGGHSLLAVSLVVQIEKQFHRKLSLASLFQNSTIEQLAQVLRLETDSAIDWSALVPIKTNGNKPPLFCVHPSGGNVLCYQNFAYKLPQEQPVYGLQAYGLNPHYQAHTSIQQMASHYIQAIQTVQAHGPYHLLGWSLGGVVVYEMAQQLVSQGESIALLAVVDVAPYFTAYETDNDAILLVWMLGPELKSCLAEIAHLEPQEQIDKVLERAKQINLLPESVTRGEIEHFLMIDRLNMQALKSYQPQAYPGSMLLIQASETDADLAVAWGRLANTVDSYVMQGNHYNLLNPPQVEALVAIMQKYLVTTFKDIT